MYNYENVNLFIKSYVKKDQQLYLNLDHHSKCTLVYSKSNERDTLNYMKYQLFSIKEYDRYIDECNRTEIAISSLNNLILSFNNYLILMQIIPCNIFSVMVSVLSLLSLIVSTMRMIQNSLKLKDYQKNLFYIINEDFINRYLKAEMTGLSKKIKLLLNEQNELNLNSIANLSQKEIEKIVMDALDYNLNKTRILTKTLTKERKDKNERHHCL